MGAGPSLTDTPPPKLIPHPPTALVVPDQGGVWAESVSVGCEYTLSVSVVSV